MSEVTRFTFHPDDEGKLLLPTECSVTVGCYEDAMVRKTVADSMEQVLRALALIGWDLRALDGITFSENCRKDAMALQSLPEGQVLLEMAERPDTVEMARTVAIRRDGGFRFHMVLRAGIARMMFSQDTALQRLAQGCVAHEAAHVDHEGHLSRMFPQIYDSSLECGNRSRQTFLKAMDVWSEYAASRSSALFRPEAVNEFEGVFLQCLKDSLSAGKQRIAAYRQDQRAGDVFMDVQQIFGDLFICAGYFLGHLDGVEGTLERDAPQTVSLLRKHPQIECLMHRLRRVLHELWLSEYAWESTDVFTPVYELICEMMALNGVAFARHQDEWRVVLCEDDHAAEAIQNALTEWLAKDVPYQI
jgi:hypothetical protein